MRTITIGRDPQCNVCYTNEKISRRHALFKLHTFGKIELVDLSSNGTFVNGVRLTPNVPFPVSRRNSVVFANEVKLDWNDIPDPFKKIKIAIFATLGVILLAIALLVMSNLGLFSSDDASSIGDGGDATEKVDIKQPDKNATPDSLSTSGSNASPSTGATDSPKTVTEKKKDSQAGRKGAWADRLLEQEKRKAAEGQSASTKSNKNSKKQSGEKKEDETPPKKKPAQQIL